MGKQLKKRLAVFFVFLLIFSCGENFTVSAQTNTNIRKVSDIKKMTNSGVQKVPDEILVKPKTGKSIDANRILSGGKTIQADKQSGLQRVKLPVGTDLNIAIQKFKADPSVAYAEPNYIRMINYVPNDQYINNQWAIEKTNAEQAWDISKGDPTLVVAIIDSGIDSDHTEFAGRIVAPYNVATQTSGMNAVLDDVGHGTHVAGIVSASINNGIGIAGIAGNSKIMPIKAGDNGYFYDSDLAAAIYYAVDHGARVINMSLGGPGASLTLQSAIDYALSHNVVVAAAAGNEGDALNEPDYPAAFDGVISVGATDQNDAPASFSNHGSYVKISAPGVNIFSTTPTYYTTDFQADYDYASGTSMATPEVAGLAALILSIKPSLNAEQVAQLIYENAKDIQSPGWDEFTGYGRIDVYKTLDAARMGSNIAYHGRWTDFISSSHSGGSAKYSNDPQAWISTTITGPSVKIIGYKSSYYGIGDVYIDDSKVGSIDYYSPSTQYQKVLFTASGLTNSAHTVKVLRTGTKNPAASDTNINIDSFIVENSVSLIEDNGQSISYAGAWNNFTSSSNSGGSAKYTEDVNASVTACFTGASLRVGGYKSSYYGIGDVYIDGNKVGSIDYFSPTTRYMQTLFEINGLTNGSHTLKIMPTGTKDAFATGTSINLDYIFPGDGTGIFQESNGAMAYQGSWLDFNSSSNSGETAKYTDGIGAFVSATFTGSSASVGGFKSSYYGIADVYLDGNKVGSIDYYSPTTQYQQKVFEVMGLSSGTHTLKILRTGNKNPLAIGTNINVDYIAVGNGIGTFEESNSSMAYSGQWVNFLTSNNSGGVAKYTDEANAAVNFNFYGTSIAISGYKAAYYGMADVYLDGVKKGTIDYYSPSTQYQQALFQTAGLTDGLHSIKLIRIGTKNPLAIGTSINIDYVSVKNGLGSFEETSDAISYVGLWPNFKTTSNSGGVAKYSEDTNATFTFNFKGAMVKIIGYKSMYYGIGDVYIDNILVGSIDYYSPSTQYQTLLFEKTGLVNGSHTLKVIHTGKKNTLASGFGINVDSFYVGTGIGRFEEVDGNLAN